ncbi:hypothetical protein COY23_01690 [bacterium (Candidatus Torokbacteria) CG_4_10_14_0_2_um_filter_35_8]|nr:MAG: hypothetical protein COY23_01690 [bacterium (Candidatus Torokbacteria) CG_4_10_14_0_2_um_filter_35_8]
MKLSTAAFSLVAALAWNEFVKTLVSTYIKKGKDVWSLLIYALLMTFVAVFVSTRAENVERKLGVKKRKK